MKKLIVALGAIPILCAFSAGACAQNASRPLVRVPVYETPYWDSNIVPRYRYRAEDDRVDPCGGPVVPVIRYGPQEATVAPEVAHALGLGLIHGRDWPCRGRRR